MAALPLNSKVAEADANAFLDGEDGKSDESRLPGDTIALRQSDPLVIVSTAGAVALPGGAFRTIIGLMEANIVALFGTGLLAGFTGAMLGLGGGIFVIPLLTLALGMPMPEAIGISLVGVAATSGTGSITYLKERLTNIRLAMVLESATTVGAVGGALLVVYLDRSLLAGLFACLLVYAAYAMAKGPRGGRWVVGRPNEVGGALDSEYLDKGKSTVVAYRVRHLPAGMGASAVAGVVSGMLGIGGGIIKVPVMTLLMGVPVKVAIATSNLMVGITAAASAFIYFYRGYVPAGAAAPVVIGICLGAWVGARVAWRASNRSLRTAFTVILGITAVMMFLKAAGVGFG